MFEIASLTQARVYEIYKMAWPRWTEVKIGFKEVDR